MMSASLVLADADTAVFLGNFYIVSTVQLNIMLNIVIIAGLMAQRTQQSLMDNME